MASQHSAHRYSESPQQDKHGQGVFFIWSCSQWGNLLAGCQETEQLYVRLKIQDFKNVMIWVPSVKNIVYSWHRVIKILLYQIIVGLNFEFMKGSMRLFILMQKCFCVSCLKRENANHCTINYMNMIKNVVFLWFVIVFFFFADIS